MDRTNIEFIQQWFTENESYSLTYNLDGATRRWYVVAEGGDNGLSSFSTRSMGVTFESIEAAREFCLKAPINDQVYWARLQSETITNKKSRI